MKNNNSFLDKASYAILKKCHFSLYGPKIDLFQSLFWIMLQIILEIAVMTTYDTEWDKTLKFECAKLRKLKNSFFGEYFEFPAKPDVLRKNQGLCALMGKIPE